MAVSRKANSSANASVSGKLESEPKKATKSDAIRTAYQDAKSQGSEPKAAELKRLLEAKGIEVSAAQISQVLKKERGDISSKKSAKSHTFTIEDMISAKKFIAKIGSTVRAKDLIDAIGS